MDWLQSQGDFAVRLLAENSAVLSLEERSRLLELLLCLTITAGDRLRRIDWKATARHGQNAADLYVRRTAALADATVLIVLDSRDDIGEQVAEWSRNTPATKGISALDVAREAASSIAAGYIQAGDRVGFQDLSSRNRMIAHGGGSRHLWRLLRAIEITQPSAVPFRHQRPPIVPPGALVYLLSSLLDDTAVRFALRWRGNGHRVIAVDVLPAAQFARTTRYERAAHRVVMMERDDRIRTLRRARRRVPAVARGRHVSSSPSPVATAEPAVPRCRACGRTAMKLPGVTARPDLSHAGARVPGVAVRAVLAIAGVLLSLVVYELTLGLAVGIMLSVAAACSPRHLFGWVLILYLAAGRLTHHPGLSWQFLVLLAGLHLLHVLAMMALELPWRSWVQLAVFVAPLRRFLVIQIPTQLLAVTALLLLAPSPHGHRPLTVAGFAVVGAVALAGLALLLAGPHLAEDPPPPSVGGSARGPGAPGRLT